MVVRRVLGEAAGVIDRAVVGVMLARSAKDRVRADRMSHDERLASLAGTREAYACEPFVAEPERFFPAPSPVAPVEKSVREGVSDLAWTSTFTPWLPAVQERYLSAVENRTARARLHVGPGGTRVTPGRPRSAVVAIHGYMGGVPLLDEPQWPIATLLRRGFDVALPVLPFHGPRGGGRRGAPPFPSSDPRMTIEGFRQAVSDVRALARLLRERGAVHVGVLGASLGGYTSALLATVCDDFDFVMPMIPLASLADYAFEHGRLGEGELAEAQREALAQAYEVVSPLARPCRVPPGRVLVAGASFDQVTPASHARRLAAHLGGALVEIPGGHLLQFGREQAFAELFAMLEREGFLSAPPRRRGRAP